MKKFKVPSTEIPWHPTVDATKCVGCGACDEFCSHSTYGWDETTQRPKVRNPYNCVVGCSSCAAQRQAEAIAFPPLSALKEYL